MASAFVPEPSLWPDWGLAGWMALLWTWTLSLAGSRDRCLRSGWSWVGEDLPAGSAQGQILAELAHLPSILLSQRGMPLSLRAEGCVSHSPLCLCGCPLEVPGLAVPVHSGLRGPGS